MIAAMAQWEREEIADRVRASIGVRAKLGKTLGGAAPFGYMWKDKKLVPDPKEAPIRKLMYELFAEQKRMKGVARLLNKAGYRTRKGAKFTDTTVERLLQDTTAKGIYRANYTYRDSKGKLCLKPESEWVLTPVEAIISEELWSQCNALHRDRERRKPLGPKPVHPFAGLLYCGCGQKMYVFSRSPKYICPKCRNKIPIEDIEGIFREELKNFFVSKDKIEAHLRKSDERLVDKRARLEAHTRRLEQVRSEMRKVYQLYTSDQIRADGFGKLYRPLEEQERNLAAELPKLQGEIDALEIKHIAAADVVTEALNLYDRWPKFNADDRRKIVESITEKIILKGDEIEISLCYAPSSEDLTKGQRNLSGSSPPRA
jgi:site-specific DNA recombinase